MNEAIQSRLDDNLKKWKPRTKEIEENFNSLVSEEQPYGNPLSGEEVLLLLEKEKQVPQPEQSKQSESKSISFESLGSFCLWYTSNRDKFSDPQKKALDTIVQAEELINKGCSCKTNQRRKAAFDYYFNFMQRNSETDLIQKIKSVSGCRTVTFKIHGFADLTF